MAPVTKVALVEGSCESLNEDNASGPYSILCLESKVKKVPAKINSDRYDNKEKVDKENQSVRKRSFENENKFRENDTYYLGNKTNSVDNLNHVYRFDETFKKNCTFDNVNSAKSSDDLRKLFFKEKIANRNYSYASTSSNESLPNDNKRKQELHNLTQSIENIIQLHKVGNQTFDLKICQNLTYSSESLNKLEHNLTHTKPTNSRYTVTTSSAVKLKNHEPRDGIDCSNFAPNSKKRTNETFGVEPNILESQSSESCNVDSVSYTPETLPYLPINKSCEDLLNDSTLEVKRRRTSNPKCHKPGGTVLRHSPLDKPNSLPQLRGSYQNATPCNSLKNLTQSTPKRNDSLDDLRKLRYSGIYLNNRDSINNKDDDNSKRDSLELEESLGILTPDQMVDFDKARSPSLENNPFLSTKCVTKEINKGAFDVLNVLNIDTSRIKETKEEVQSPNITSVTEYSLGLIDPEQLQSVTILKTDTTMNLELPLDSIVNNSKDFTLTRCEETPSPEELPLDTTPIVESEPKSDNATKSKTSNSFVTSITSITSLDNGYQGDGEMSRPASRGPDNSPLTRRPYPRPQPRRPDPMTDSDFYTESDVDNHEDNQIKGDRRAQVIDGTLYGVDPQAAADIYVNNRENMDSSGIFTDIESGLRNEDEIENDHDNENSCTVPPDVSPSDSSKTISGNSQSNLQEILQQNVSLNDTNESLNKTVKENPKKRTAPSPGISSPSSLSSPRHHSKDENAAKKYKMPKREVASKVKAMIGPSQSPSAEKKVVKKPVNRWDAVMNKISKNEQNKTNLKDIKSKVFDNVHLNNSPSIPRNETRKTNQRPVVNQNNKTRRIRTRTTHNSSPLKKVITGNVESSIHSSLSDLSASTTPPKKSPSSAKKREAIQVTQVLTPNKLSTRNQQNLAESKKNANISPSSSNELKNRRNIFSSKEKPKQQSTLPKESSKLTVKGGRTSPSVRPPAPQPLRAPAKKAPPLPRTAEALAVLVQHLVFNVEAFQVPHLRREVEKCRIETEEIRLACRQLEDALADERGKQIAVVEEERSKCHEDIVEMVEKHRVEVAQLTQQHEQELILAKENVEKQLSHKHEAQLRTVRQELEKLQRSHEQSLEILREENDAIREEVDEKNLELEKVNHESIKLKQDYESKEIKLKEEVDMMKQQKDRLKQQIIKLELDYQEKIDGLIEENKRLREENDRLLSYGDDKDIGAQEVQSLRAVLELKQTEVADLRKSLGQANHKLDILINAEEKALALHARCEDLQHQLQRKSEYEQNLIQENQKLQESFKEEINQKRRLSQYNEELQWKLRQNKDVITKVIEQAEETVFNRSNVFSSSFSEKHSAVAKANLERTLSFREKSLSNKSNASLDTSLRSRKSKPSLETEMEDLSPPSSPKVKGVVEKSDSVSYVLDLDESPDVVASRIVRRSFRNTTPPKNTPTKSPSNKRPRMRNPLSTSASSSSIITSNREECDRPKSASSRNGNSDDDVFMWNNTAQSTPVTYDEDKRPDSRLSTSPGIKLDDDLDEDHEVDLELPALPSEMDKRNGILALPSPKHLAGDANVSDSNSEDESTSSSQL